MRKENFILGVVFLILLYTRLVGLKWGLPYPMHPDERNMVDALVQLKCPADNLQECMNPNFYAYGQAPLYVGYGLAQSWHAITGNFNKPITFDEGTISLRMQSALFSVLLVFVLWKIFELVYGRKPDHWLKISAFLIFIFQPYAIQFAHFGTTETILMLLYASIVYVCLRLSQQVTLKWVVAGGAVLGLAIGIKTSSILFAGLPVLTLVHAGISQKKRFHSLLLIPVTILFAILASPHNIIHFSQFMQSMNYEIPVGQGTLKVFYTRQFDNTIPVLFHFTHIFPYTLGIPALILSLIGFLVLSWKHKQTNILRLSWLIFFIPTALVYAKWTRFAAPIMPIMTLFAVLAFANLWDRFKRKAFIGVLLAVVLLPGIAFLSIYQHPDVRFEASQVITRTIPAGSKVLEEAGNVINIPVPSPGLAEQLPFYDFYAFDVYNLDTQEKSDELSNSLNTADAVIIPSRRIFANHSCYLLDHTLLFQDCEIFLKSYPFVNQYYEKLLGPNSRFIESAKITSYPRIELFGTILMQFPDEQAEETWTVFDHPVIRIYKRKP